MLVQGRAAGGVWTHATNTHPLLIIQPNRPYFIFLGNPLGLRMTPQEYADWDREQAERHEYYAGEVLSQAGGMRRHSLIGSNILSGMNQLLKESACQAHGSDMRIHIEATGYQAYPDVSVVCPPVEGESDEVVSNPVLVVEVLSPSTADFDRGGKIGHYRQIPSLMEYLFFGRMKLESNSTREQPRGYGCCESWLGSSRFCNWPA